MTLRTVALSLALLTLGAVGPAAAIGTDTTSAGSAELVRAEAAVKAGRYRDAIRSLTVVVSEEPRNADAHNYLGYAHRKLGEFPAALKHYEQALAIDPNHRGANEYLGELHLQMNDLPKAEAQLEKLSRICFLGCEELDELRAAVEQFRKTGKLS